MGQWGSIRDNGFTKGDVMEVAVVVVVELFILLDLLQSTCYFTSEVRRFGVKPGIVPNPSAPGIAGSNGQTFSNYTFSRSTNPAGYCRYLLPVKLVTFSASVIDKKVLLEWQIDNPETVKRFIVEKSVIANQWMELKILPGNDQKRDYTTVDENPLPGRMYYRIKFVEKNNTLSYSPVRQVVTGNTNEFLIYPNPARDKIMIAGNMNGPAVIKLLDVSGKIILQKNIVNTPAEINLPNLSSGIYLLRINQSVQKLVIR
ncbi:MAG: T9SS type A sorting domain-containing protein [Chitinophagaceae bacterium]|nr:T9SS type A sorting domain-containing protein [Chitinophagaceae bacterium]